MTNSSANATNSKANAPNPIAKASNSIAKATNSTAKAPYSIANGTNSTAKVTNSIAKTCMSFLSVGVFDVHSGIPCIIKFNFLSSLYLSSFSKEVTVDVIIETSEARDVGKTELSMFLGVAGC